MRTIIFPGQGAQYRGMGKDLFRTYPEHAARASEILGYSIEKLCVEDPENKLRLTQYTQPALYVVNALAYSKMCDEADSQFKVDFLAGHSLGEYNALHAAEAFDFETGVKLVQKRGELMGEAKGGGMAAIIGAKAEQIKALLRDHQLDSIDFANFNTPTQIVIAGGMEALLEAEKLFSKFQIRCVILNVSAPFHSRYMKHAQGKFTEFLKSFEFQALKIPVIANTTARPYEGEHSIARSLCNQIACPVLWTDSIRYLMGREVLEFVEVRGNILTKMVTEIQKTESPIIDLPEVKKNVAEVMVNQETGSVPLNVIVIAKPPHTQLNLTEVDCSKQGSNAIDTTHSTSLAMAALLGSEKFRSRFGLKYAYVAGAMYRGIASTELVIRMGNAGLLSFFGSGGLRLSEIEKAIRLIQGQLTNGEPFGMNLLANYDQPEFEKATVDLYLKYEVKNVEASAFMQLTPALILYRAKGLRKNPDGAIICENKLLAKVSRPEIAEIFMSPAPTHIVQKLVHDGLISTEQAGLLALVPVSHDICIEADSGGHTDGGIATVLLPTMFRLKDELSEKYNYQEPLCMGIGGGIGTPEAAAAAFIMGADFILTGSINQCTIDAGISSSAKDLLQEINIQDTDYAPAGDMFELGAKVQVLKKAVFFPARANKLFSLYSHYNSLDEIPEKTKKQLQTSYFKKSFDQVWADTVAYLKNHDRHHDIIKGEANPKYKMALVFRWYFGYSTQLAFDGCEEDRVNYQIHTGPALGAFNQWVKGTALESWANRHADEIGLKLMVETAKYLESQLKVLSRIFCIPLQKKSLDEHTESYNSELID